MQLGCDKASLSRTVHGLETKGYIVTDKIENDKRMKSVSLTDTGTETIKNAENQAEEYSDRILEANYNRATMDLLVKIFSKEQEIPQGLIPISPKLKPS